MMLSQNRVFVTAPSGHGSVRGCKQVAPILLRDRGGAGHRPAPLGLSLFNPAKPEVWLNRDREGANAR